MKGSLQPSDAGDAREPGDANDVGDAGDPEDTGPDVEPGDAGDDTAPDADVGQDAGEDCDCPSGSYCHPDSGECVECLSWAHCPNYQQCDANNECVDRPCSTFGDCNDGDDGMFCKEETRCLYQLCQNANDPCSRANPDQELFQGDTFLCMPDATSGHPDVGKCVPNVCYVANTRSVCPDGSFCRHGSNSNLRCKRSECLRDTDCTGGSQCILMASDYGICSPTGSTSAGSACGGPSGGRCMSGTVCNTVGGDNQCRTICAPDGDECTGGDDCALRTEAMGVCMTPDSQTTPYASCSVEGAPCGDDTFMGLCRLDPRPGENRLLVCMPMCRTAERTDDCSEVTPNRQSTVCNVHLEPGTKELGFCTPECGRDSDCTGATNKCVHGVCRMPCTASRVCNDQLPGDSWICVDGYCE